MWAMRAIDAMGSRNRPAGSPGRGNAPRSGTFMYVTGYFAAETAVILPWVPTTAAVGMK
jgi:hypothetical protein